MKSSIGIGCLAPLLCIGLTAQSAFAQGPSSESSPSDRGLQFGDHAVPAVRRAIEIAGGVGYTQGVGNVAHGGPSVQDISGPGSGFQLSLGTRVFSNLALGAYGTFAVYGNSKLNNGYDARGATAGVYADWHFRPTRSLDPWLGMASGWRGQWLLPESGRSTSLQGLEIARLQAGSITASTR